MTSEVRRRRTALAVGAAFAVLLALLAAQFARSRWPFARPAPGPHVHGGAQQPVAHESHAGMAMDGGMPPSGYAPVTIAPDRAAALQLTTALVERRDFTRTVRTVGVVTLDETRSAHVHARVRGWIDRLEVNFVGKQVKAGDPLCTLYSQDVYSAEIELLSVLGRSTGPGADPIVEAARQRLLLWDVPKSEVERLVRTRQARRTFPLLAPRAGTVVAKQAIQGMYVDPSLELYTLSDLSRVWVLADAYEADVPYVKLGDVARVTLEGEERPLEVRVSFLSPTIDEATRTRKVRLELENPGGRLLPGAFATVELKVPMGQGVAVPESAVVRTGTRSIVFVVSAEHANTFEPREVTLGPLVGDHYRVDRGLAPGERVATGAQFLLDSESRLRATSAPGGAHAH